MVKEIINNFKLKLKELERVFFDKIVEIRKNKDDEELKKIRDSLKVNN